MHSACNLKLNSPLCLICTARTHGSSTEKPSIYYLCLQHPPQRSHINTTATLSVPCQDWLWTWSSRGLFPSLVPGALLSHVQTPTHWLSWWHNSPHTSSVQPISSVKCTECATYQRHPFRAQNRAYKQTQVCVCATTQEPDTIQSWRCCMCFSPVDTEGLDQAKILPITQNHPLLLG